MLLKLLNGLMKTKLYVPCIFNNVTCITQLYTIIHCLFESLYYSDFVYVNRGTLKSLQKYIKLFAMFFRLSYFIKKKKKMNAFKLLLKKVIQRLCPKTGRPKLEWPKNRIKFLFLIFAVYTRV